MTSNFDLDVHSYTLDELYTMINVKQTDDIPFIKQRINAIVHSVKDGEIDYNYVVFIKNIEQRIIDSRHEEDMKEQIKIYTEKILNEKIKSVEETYINKYPKGELNPIKRNVLTQLVSIDSVFRTNYDNTDADNFIYTLSNPVNKVISIRLSSLEIPTIWYGFSTTRHNNKFIIRMTHVPKIAISDMTGNDHYSVTTIASCDDMYVEHTLVIPDGNYNAEEFEHNMNHYLLNVGNGLQYLRFTIDPNTGRSIFYLRGPHETTDRSNVLASAMDPDNEYHAPDLCYELDFATSQNLHNNMEENCGWTMGFRSGEYMVKGSTQTINNFTAKELSLRHGVIVSEGAYGTSLNNYFFVCVDDYNNNYKNSIISDKNFSYLGDSILGRISNSGSANTIMNDNGSDHIFKKREYFGPVKVDKLKISIIDKYGKRLMLNKNDFSMTLELELLYG